MKFLICFTWLVYVANPSSGQIWDINIPFLSQMYGSEECSKNGVDPKNLLPDLPESSDPWFFNFNCLNYEGSVTCADERLEDGLMIGYCKCNQGDDNEFNDDDDSPMCLGKVGAICTAEVPSFVPEKKCVPNSECRPDQGGAHTVGKCWCVDGYVEDPATRKCIEIPGVPDDERSTPRVPSTTETPEKGNIPLPIKLLIGMQFVELDEACVPNVLLNRTYCATHGRTVSCVDKKCQCNMGEEAAFSRFRNKCVGLAGSYCLNRPNLLGSKPCTMGAKCIPEDVPEHANPSEFSLGVCRCSSGLQEQEDGTCTLTGTSSSTTTTTADPGPTTTTTTTTTTDEGEESSSTSTSNSTSPADDTTQGANQVTLAVTPFILLLLSFAFIN